MFKVYRNIVRFLTECLAALQDEPTAEPWGAQQRRWHDYLSQK